jgi:gluconokinase
MIVVLMGCLGLRQDDDRPPRRPSGSAGAFIEGDDYHPPANVAKMAAGIPLEDTDRWPWLDQLNRVLRAEHNAIVSCSALKESIAAACSTDHRLPASCFLEGSKALIAERVSSASIATCRPRSSTASSQTLEPPRDAIRIDVGAPVERSVDAIVQWRSQGASSRRARSKSPHVRLEARHVAESRVEDALQRRAAPA